VVSLIAFDLYAAPNKINGAMEQVFETIHNALRRYILPEKDNDCLRGKRERLMDDTWVLETEKLIDCVNTEDLPRQMVESLSTLVPFTMALIVIYRGRSRPLCLYDSFPDEKAKSGIKNYINGTYVLNPVYLAHRKGMTTGVYRMRDLAPDGYFDRDVADIDKFTRAPSEEIGFITKDWPKGQEELVIMIELGNGVTGEIDLFCSMDNHVFDDSALDLIRERLPIISAIMRKHWLLREVYLSESPMDARIDELFEAFGKPELSDREHEVVQHILRGHSSESISYNLDISITTVKTHRKRAYAKLNISSQSELLSVFLQSIAPHLAA